MPRFAARTSTRSSAPSQPPGASTHSIRGPAPGAEALAVGRAQPPVVGPERPQPLGRLDLLLLLNVTPATHRPSRTPTSTRRQTPRPIEAARARRLSRL